MGCYGAKYGFTGLLVCGILMYMGTKKSVKKKSVAKRNPARTVVRAGKRVAKKKPAKKVAGRKGVVKKGGLRRKVVGHPVSKRASKKGPYTYNTPVSVVARDYNLKSPAAPNMKLGDFLKQQKFYSLAKMLGG